MASSTTLRDRFALPALLLLSALGAYGAGLTWMTHMHHRELEYVNPDQMAAFDAGYETLSDLTVIPVGVIGLVCGLAVLAWRPRGVPVWMIGLNLVLQVSVFITRIWLWGAWAEEVRESGAVRLADGSFHPSYTRYMDTNWVRIAIISGYALLSLTMAIVAVSRRKPAGSANQSPELQLAAV